MTFALGDDCTPLPGLPVRSARGRAGHFAGHATEDAVARDYEGRGYPVLRRNWRGKGGEIDLIAQDGAGLVFIEVKQSRNFDAAVARLSARQIARLQAAAEEFLGTQPRGLLTDMRFDVALVDGRGDLRVIENAIGH